MRRDALILAGIFVLLAAFIALGPARVTSTPGSSASSHASGPQGALALFRWLEALSYDVDRIQHTAFAPDAEADLMLVLGPSERYTVEAAEAVAAWVAEGGTLIVADDQAGAFGRAGRLLEAFDLRIAALPEDLTPALDAPVLQPILGAPPARLLRAEASAAISSERADLAYLAGDERWPTLVGLQHGEGYVFAASAVHPFSNAGLSQGDNAAMVLNLLRRVPAGGRVVFDEYHHGFVGAPSLRSLLLGTPWGWAIMYAALVAAGYLALTGRRFGRPTPLREEAGRRSSAEYMESMAGLLRRAGKADFAQAHYRAGLKRRLARTYGLNPQLDDEPFLAALAEVSPAQAQTAAGLLARLALPADEVALLRLVAEADQLASSR